MIETTTMTEKTHRDCGDCGARPGELHAVGCDVERCPRCGLQAISCGCDLLEDWVSWDEKRMPWTGEWPGTPECREYGFYCRHIEGREPYWIPCGPGDEGAVEDFNRLVSLCKWDQQQQRWVKR